MRVESKGEQLALVAVESNDVGFWRTCGDVLCRRSVKFPDSTWRVFLLKFSFSFIPDILLENSELDFVFFKVAEVYRILVCNIIMMICYF